MCSYLMVAVKKLNNYLQEKNNEFSKPQKWHHIDIYKLVNDSL